MVADDALIARIRSRLLPVPEEPAEMAPDWAPDVPFIDPPVPAAVLIALVRHETGATVLYTERSANLRAHSGQVAFPGGRIDPGDDGPGAAALREAMEEVALVPADATILGYMPNYFTGTNYLITPVVATVNPSAPFVANPGEVDAVFEVPLALLADERSYTTFRIRRGEADHTVWQIDHDGHRIWGATAKLTRSFRDLALAGDHAW